MQLIWDQVGQRFYETGVDHGVLYPLNTANNQYDNGVAWSGLTKVTEKPSGAEAKALYADNIKYLNMRSKEDFGATIEAFTFPDEFALLDGSAQLTTGVKIRQQTRGMFGLAYRSLIGNDTDGDDHGYKLHLVYGATVSPSEVDRETVNEDPNAATLSWELTTAPVAVTGFKPTAHLEIDSTDFDAPEKLAKLKALEAVLYGTDAHSEIPATYKATEDLEPVTGKTYYTKSGDIYTEFTGSTFATGTTYYEMVTPAIPASSGTTARLPLPDEVKSIIDAA